MFKYYFFFVVFVILANFGYGFGQIGRGKTEVFSLPVFLATVGISVTGLIWIHKRWNAVQKKKEPIQLPETTRGK